MRKILIVTVNKPRNQNKSKESSQRKFKTIYKHEKENDGDKLKVLWDDFNKMRGSKDQCLYSKSNHRGIKIK